MHVLCIAGYLHIMYLCTGLDVVTRVVLFLGRITGWFV